MFYKIRINANEEYITNLSELCLGWSPSTPQPWADENPVGLIMGLYLLNGETLFEKYLVGLPEPTAKIAIWQLKRENWGSELNDIVLNASQIEIEDLGFQKKGMTLSFVDSERKPPVMAFKQIVKSGTVWLEMLCADFEEFIFLRFNGDQFGHDVQEWQLTRQQGETDREFAVRINQGIEQDETGNLNKVISEFEKDPLLH